MRVVLEVVSEKLTGRKIWLQEGQTVEVGRTEHADFVVPHDPLMADVQFRLKCDRSSCRIHNCGREGKGTTVNGQLVSDALLRDGDEINTGRTTFVVSIERNGQPATGEPCDLEPEKNEPAAPRDTARPALVVGDWTFRCFPSGWDPMEGQGLRATTQERFPSTVIAMQYALPDEFPFEKHVEALVEELRRSNSGGKVDEPRSVEIDGVDEAVEISILYQGSDSYAITQRVYLASESGTVGRATVTTLAGDLEELNPQFEEIIAGLRFSPSQREQETESSQ